MIFVKEVNFKFKEKTFSEKALMKQFIRSSS